MIPKAKGGTRKIGIPTVRDRVIQQAISQLLNELYDKSFSESSYGFRRGRKVVQALCKASEYVASGKHIVVDIDMKNFFDEVNHDRLMYRLSRRIGDKVLLQLIRKYLQSGVMRGGLISQRKKGTPQGSPLSPILSNIVLDELDKELEKRGHSFIRYADDISIYVSSHEAGKRVKATISNYLTRNLKLQVNEDKSKVSEVSKAEILGHTILYDGTIVVSHPSRMRLRDTVKEITRRNRGVSFATVIAELNTKLRGWFEYFKHSKSKSLFQSLDSWIRRKLRCYRMKQTKRVIGLFRFLKQQGVKTRYAWILALSGKGWWRKSSSPQAHQAMGNSWFNEQNLFSLSLNYGKLNN